MFFSVGKTELKGLEKLSSWLAQLSLLLYNSHYVGLGNH